MKKHKYYNPVLRIVMDEEPQESDIKFLIDDEYEAIDGYNKVIEKSNNPKLIELLKHIRDEEIEHVEELKKALNGIYEE